MSFILINLKYDAEEQAGGNRKSQLLILVFRCKTQSLSKANLNKAMKSLFLADIDLKIIQSEAYDIKNKIHDFFVGNFTIIMHIRI